MAKTIMFGLSTQSIAASTTRYIDSRGDASNATEANAQVRFPTCTISNLSVIVSANDRATSTVTFRKNTADGNNTVSITGSTTGTFSDTTHTDSVTAGDWCNWKLVTGAGGTTIVLQHIGYVIQAATSTAQVLDNSFFGNVSTASTTTYNPVPGNGGGNTTESNIVLIYYTAGTASLFYATVGTNARSTTTTLTTRKNSAAGNGTISVGAGATGQFADTTNSDTIVSGDTFNIACTTGTGTGNFTLGHSGVVFTTTNDTSIQGYGHPTGATVNAAVTTYIYLPTRQIIGAPGFNTTESQTQALLPFAGKYSSFYCNISANTVTATSTFRFRKNTANGNQTLSIASSTTGDFHDTTNTDTVVPGDLVNLQMVTGGTGTSLTVKRFACVFQTYVIKDQIGKGVIPCPRS